MRHIDDNDLLKILGMRQCKRPCDTTAPIVSNEYEPFVSEMFSECAHIRDQIVYAILFDVGGFGGEIIASHIGSDREVITAKLGKLIPPCIPEFRKTVQEHDHLPLARRDIMQAETV